MPTAPDVRFAFAKLCSEAASCTRCASMVGRRRVLSDTNGRPGAPVMFVAEAPGRLGAEVSGVPLSGDRAGRRFEALLDSVGWSRADVFVTNAVLCNPRTGDGRLNRSPARAELDACGRFLARQIDLVDPLVVVALGTVALRALGALQPHDLRLARDVGRPARWGTRWLVPLYHPGERALRRRSADEQAADFRRLARFVERLMATTTADRDTHIGRRREGAVNDGSVEPL